MEGQKTPLGVYGTTPLKEGLPAGVLTDEKTVGPFSFYDPKNWPEKQAKAPVPTYLSLEQLNTPIKVDKTTLFKDFEEQKSGDLKLKDQELKSRQKGVLLNILKDCASKLVEGKGIVGLSLPVRIFEPRSIIERICDMFLYSSYYLNRAAVAEEPEERIKMIMGFLIAALPHAINQWKPFNPLLGETYQATLVDGTTIECEHTSHHPPITNYYVKNKAFKIYGSLTINGELHANSINAFNEGWGTVEFADKEKYKFCLPSIYVWGLVVNSRGLQITAPIVVYHEPSQTKGVLKYSADAKKGLSSYFSSSRNDMVRGSIYKYHPDKHQAMVQKGRDKWYAMLNELADMPDVVKKLITIEGSWLREIRADGELLWSIQTDLQFAQQHFFVENPLPSDCRFREDLVWLTKKSEENAQVWKVKLEEQQRHERALRNKKNPPKK